MSTVRLAHASPVREPVQCPLVDGTEITNEAASPMSTCASCEAGTYRTSEGAGPASTCVNCETCIYITSAGASPVSACANCEAGSHRTSKGASSVSTCINCGMAHTALLRGPVQCPLVSIPSQARTASVVVGARAVSTGEGAEPFQYAIVSTVTGLLHDQ